MKRKIKTKKHENAISQKYSLPLTGLHIITM